MPVAATVSVALWPDVTDWLAGCEVMTGATADGVLETVIVAADESTEPAGFDTRTQNVDVVVRAGVPKSAPVAPAIGVDVLPLAPAYH